MDYQKLLNEEQISKIYVEEGDIVSFYNLNGRLCTKDSNGKITVVGSGSGTGGDVDSEVIVELQNKVGGIEEEVNQIKTSLLDSETLIQEIDDLVGGEDLNKQEAIQASEELLSVL